MALFYLDSSAIVKLVHEEPESEALREFLDHADLVASELALVEVPRAVRRMAAADSHVPIDALMSRAEQVIGCVGLAPLDRSVLLGAGALAEPMLRALDAIHVATAVGLGPIDAFVSYDDRQSAAARLASLRTMSPGT